MATLLKKIQCAAAVLLLIILETKAQTTTPEPPSFCVIYIDKHPKTFKPPFVINPDGSDSLVQYPIVYNGERALIIPQGSKRVVACPGDKNTFQDEKNKKSIDVKCNDGQLIYVDTQIIVWEQLGCLDRPTANLVKIPNQPCGNGGSQYAIKWNIRSNLNVDQVKICFNENTDATEYTLHKIQGSSIGIRSVDTSSPDFRDPQELGMFAVDLQCAYKKKIQKKLFKHLLGTDEHLTGVGEHYLAKGHLAANADFVYIAEQHATYFYANVAPEWQSLNNGYWKRLEHDIRVLAESHTVALNIWTGTYDKLQFHDTNNNLINMFLGLSQWEEVIPVPAVMWKVIHDPIQKLAVAVFFINEFQLDGTSEVVRRLKTNPPPFINVCNQIKWITFNTHDNNSPTFCSAVDDLRLSLIPILPNLGPVGLLTQ